jgi:cytochrome c peroxidase
VNFAKAIAAYEYTLISRESAFDTFVAQGSASTAISPAAKRGARLFVGKASCIDCHSGPLFSDGGFHNIAVPQVGDHVPTVADCPQGNTRCDCTVGDEKSTCLPSGAWAGLLRLANSVEPATGINFNNTRRDSMWSDDGSDASRAAYYTPPTDTSLKGAWRTPSLRDTALTPPYMHTGYYRTLEEVVWHYNVGGASSGAGQFDTSPARAVQLKALGLREDEQADLVEFLKTLTGAPQDPTKVVKPPVPDAGVLSPPPDAGSPPDAGASDAASQ